MTSVNKQAVWVWDDDDDLLDEGGAFIEIDYDRSTLASIDFWDANLCSRFNGRIVYTATEAHMKKLSDYAYYPCTRDVPVISTEMKRVIEAICSSNEVRFHACEILTRTGKKLEAWNLAPLDHLSCIDRNRSNITWETTGSSPTEWEIKSADLVVFNSSCLGDNNIARVKEDPSWIIVSGKLKEAIESFNKRGLSFKGSKESRIGKPFWHH